MVLTHLQAFLANNSAQRRAFNFFPLSLAPDSTILEQTRWVFATQERRGARHTLAQNRHGSKKKALPAAATRSLKKLLSRFIHFVLFSLGWRLENFCFSHRESFAAASSSRLSFSKFNVRLSLINQ